MKIYDEITNEELTSPDLSAGYLYTARRVAEHVPESQEVLIVIGAGLSKERISGILGIK